MAEENKPGKVSLESTELKLGGVNIKGAYIVWFGGIVMSVSGAIWGAGKVWSDYETLKTTVASIKMPDGEPVVKLIEKVDQLESTATNLSQAIAANEAAITKATNDLAKIQTLVEANDVSKIQGAIATLRTSVEGVQVFTRDVQTLREGMVGVQKDMAGIKKDVDSQWSAIDSIGAGSLKGGK
jgi:uncharacterized membrane protein